METRGNFGSKLGVILATAGSAVGLGNVWRFPYMAGQNGGAAFILIYLVCIILLGLPGMMSEFIIGRHSASNAARAYTNLGKHKAWGALGLMGIITSMIILGFYAVVAGWCLAVSLCQYHGRCSWRCRVCEDLFPDLFSRSYPSYLMGSRFYPAYPHGGSTRCAQWYRESIQDTDAYALLPVDCDCDSFLLSAGSDEGSGVPAGSRISLR